MPFAPLLAALLLSAGPVPPKLRLPSGVTPRRGALDLKVDPAAERYRGTARYQVRLAAAAKVIWLHAEGLEIERATVGGRGARAVRAEGGFLGLVVEPAAPAGELEVALDFSAPLDRVRSRGAYAVQDGERWYAYTFFEPIDARRAFPCFDEPGAKIPWRVTLHVKSGDLAVANAPLASETPEPGGTRFEFAETRPLPSYLVAFVVGPFDLVDGGAAGGGRVPVRFVVPKGRGAETRYAAEVTPRMIEVLERFIGVDYPYEKCDVAVVPSFWGTMEHPGLVALGQPLTLIPPGEETRERRERYVNIGLHELAHHWFGDLVTNGWWDDTWLNESLATWTDAATTQLFEPAWRTLEEASWHGRAAAFSADVNASARRVHEPVVSRHEIEGSFDGEITYAKGAAVARMFEAFLGPGLWRNVLKRHLVRHADGTATTDDFLATLAEVGGQGAADAYRTFLDQPGVPLVQATVSCSRGLSAGTATVKVTQSRFLASGAVDRKAAWRIPVCLAAGQGSETRTTCALVGPGPGEVKLPFCPDWLWPNAGGLGYYLSALPKGSVGPLLPRLAPAERLALVTDAQLLARRGDLPLAEALDLVAPLAAAEDRLQVSASQELTGLLSPAWLADRELASWRAFVRRTFGERARALGWLPRPADGEEPRALRRQVVPLVAGEGAEAVLAGEALALARRWLNDRRQVPAEVARAALPVAAARGDRALFDKLVAEAARTPERTERRELTALLGTFEDQALLAAGLAQVGAPGSDPRDTLPILQAALGGRATRALGWKTLVAQWPRLAPRLRSDEATWLITDAAALACDPKRRREVESFLKARAEPFDGAPRALKQALEEAAACAAARARHGKAAAAFLTRVAAP